MTEYLIASPAPATVVAVDEFRRAVLADWPAVAFVPAPAEAGMTITAWIRQSPDRWDDLVLDLHETGAALSIDCRIETTVAEVALWWRRLIGPADELWLFDPAGTDLPVAAARGSRRSGVPAAGRPTGGVSLPMGSTWCATCILAGLRRG